MKQFAAWQAPFYSLWSKGFYIDVAKNWRGLAYGYLFVLVCFTWVFIAAKFQMDFSYFIEHDYYPLVERMPTVNIDNGIVSIDKPCPYNLTTAHGIPVVTFDTREKPMSLDEIPSNFLVTRDGIYFKASSYGDLAGKSTSSPDLTKEQKIDLSTIRHQVIDQSSARQIGSDIARSVGLFIFLLFVPLAFIFCIFQTLLYGLIGLLIVKLNKADLSYGTLVRLSAVALTPVLLIDSIVKVRGLQLVIQMWSVIAFLIGMGYVIFAISANVMNEDNKQESSNL